MENKILETLHGNEVGLGYNQLIRRGFYKKTLDKYLPKLKKKGLVMVKQVAVRGGTRKLHVITEEGKKVVRRERLRRYGAISAMRWWDDFHQKGWTMIYITDIIGIVSGLESMNSQFVLTRMPLPLQVKIMTTPPHPGTVTLYEKKGVETREIHLIPDVFYKNEALYSSIEELKEKLASFLSFADLENGEERLFQKTFVYTWDPEKPFPRFAELKPLEHVGVLVKETVTIKDEMRAIVEDRKGRIIQIIRGKD